MPDPDKPSHLPFRSSTRPDAEQVFAYSQSYVASYEDSPISQFDPHGPTRLLVVMTVLGPLKEFTYTAMATIDPDMKDEDVRELLLHGDSGQIVWRGPKSAVVYFGPEDGYTRPSGTEPFPAP